MNSDNNSSRTSNDDRWPKAGAAASITRNESGDPEPLISVVIPCHNGAEYIEECIDSVRLEDDGRTELIVVEDSSTDASWELIKTRSKALRRLRCYRVSFGSPAKTRNYGIRKARGSMIATLDADDYFLPSRLSSMLSFINREGADIAISDCFEVASDDRMVRFSATHSNKCGELTVDDYLRYIMPVPPMFLAKKSAIEQIGFYDEDLRYLEDQDLFIRALQDGLKISYLDEPLYVHRLRPDTLSTAKVEESLAWRDAYRRHRRSRKFNARQRRIVLLQLLATTFRYYYFRYAPNLSWPKKMKILRKVF
jgi:glycosyltransferase involved in cell wall biosynthesis